MQGTRIRSLGQEDPLEEDVATHSSVLAGESQGQRNLVGHGPQSHKELETTEATSARACICVESTLKYCETRQTAAAFATSIYLKGVPKL